MPDGLPRRLLVRLSGGRWGRRLVAEANAARDRQDWPQAAELYRLALDRKPHLRSLLVQRGTASDRAGRESDAFGSFATFLGTHDGARDVAAHVAFAALLARTGNAAAAAFHLGQVGATESGSAGSEPPSGAGRLQEWLAELARCEAESADVARLRACAAMLARMGWATEAETLAGLAELRVPHAPDRRAGDMVEIGRGELAHLLALARTEMIAPGGEHSSFEVPLDFAQAPRPAGLAPDDILDQSRRRLAEFRHLLFSDEEPDSLARWLEAARCEVLEAPPLVSFGSADPDIPRHVGRVLHNGLRRFLAEHRHLAYPPFGSAAVLRACARLDRSGVGPFLDLAGRLVADGTNVLALAHLAASDAGPERPAVADLEVVATWLGVHLSGRVSTELIQQLGDFRLPRAIGGIVAYRLAAGDPNRLMLEAARDGYLDCGMPGEAKAIQFVSAAIRPGDSTEEAILRDMTDLAEGRAAPDAHDALERRFARDPRRAAQRATHRERLARERLNFTAEAELFATVGASLDLAPEMVVAPPDIELAAETLDLLHLGWSRRTTPWGRIPTLRGIEAIRVRCPSAAAVDSFRVFLDGQPVAELWKPEPPPTGRPVLNAWFDVRDTAPGPHLVEAVCIQSGGMRSVRREHVLVETPSRSDRDALSDAVVPLAPDPDGDLDARVNALPSVVRRAGRSLFGAEPKRVLVARADQLGDFVASIPAIRRLRELLPTAELYGLTTPANEALARSLGIFADVVTAELTYSHVTKKRHMAVERQAALRDTLARLRLDLAIDLSASPDTRPILRLSGAPNLVGFKPAEFPWLTFGIDARAHDPVNGKERASHATMVLTLVEAFGAALRHRSITAPHPDVRASDLSRFGLSESDAFAVLHAGARIDFKRWPFASYLALAQHILQRTELKVVLLSDDPDDEALVRGSGAPADRLRFVGQHVSFPELEALLAFCRVFVGNDTGPKHLAALRGAKVVSVHMGQVNWDEWGQEGDGLIVSRRVPCCGCGIDRTEDCGKDLACLVHIRPNEVFEAVQQILSGKGRKTPDRREPAERTDFDAFDPAGATPPRP